MCIIPRRRAAARRDGRPTAPAVYGHGLLGSEREVERRQRRATWPNEHNFVFCATKWIGLSEEDVGNAVSVLEDLSRFPTIADRLQQGILNTLFLGRLMIARGRARVRRGIPGTPTATPVIDRTELFYDGNSQGGIMGGAATAVAQDWNARRARRPRDELQHAAAAQHRLGHVQGGPRARLSRPDRPHASPSRIVQMLWDRGEANGYAQHLTRDPYPDTPKHQCCSTRRSATTRSPTSPPRSRPRTIGARVQPARARATADHSDRQPLWGIARIDGFPYDGSAHRRVGQRHARRRPSGNVAPEEGEDPHERPPRLEGKRARQKSEFLKRNGRVVDVCEANPARRLPRPDELRDAPIPRLTSATTSAPAADRANPSSRPREVRAASRSRTPRWDDIDLRRIAPVA